MFNLTLTYENDCRAEELEPIKASIISGISGEELLEVCDDWYYIDSAVIELAIDNGWDVEAAMHSDEIDEILNDVLCYDWTQHDSIRSSLVNDAYDYLAQHGIVS